MMVGLDKFPAKLTGPGGVLSNKLRVIVADGVLYAFGISGKFEHRVDGVTAVEKPRGAAITVTTESGVWKVSAGAGCGCSSSLKRIAAATLVARAQGL
jgi:hypothetical protein